MNDESDLLHYKLESNLVTIRAVTLGDLVTIRAVTLGGLFRGLQPPPHFQIFKPNKRSIINAFAFVIFLV